MRLLLLALLLASGCATTRPTECDDTQQLVAEGWENYRAERAYLDSTYMAERDSLIAAQAARR